MTKRERILSVLKRQKPDRLPWSSVCSIKDLVAIFVLLGNSECNRETFFCIAGNLISQRVEIYFQIDIL
jgi:hypothetical protein